MVKELTRLLGMGQRWFVLGLFLVPLLAWIRPTLGADHGFLRADILNQVAVIIIFFISGLGLRYREVVAAAEKWKFNLFIQGGCFLLFPAAVLLLNHTVFETLGLHPAFIIGTIILSAVPITTTTCIVLSEIVKGDEPGALYNSILSNLLGAFIAPIILTYLLNTDGYALKINPWPIITMFCYLTIIPMLTGLFIRHLFHQWMHRKHIQFSHLQRVSEALLLFIIYSAFCNSFIESKSLDSPWQQLSLLIGAMIILHVFLLLIAYFQGLFGFTIPERKTMLLTIPQKTVAVGIPLNIAITSNVEFQTAGVNLAFYSLPLLIYNNIQWLAAGLLLYILMRWKSHKGAKV